MSNIEKPPRMMIEKKRVTREKEKRKEKKIANPHPNPNKRRGGKLSRTKCKCLCSLKNPTCAGRGKGNRATKEIIVS